MTGMQSDSDRLAAAAPTRASLVQLLGAPFLAFTRHWSLTRELVRSEVLGRYRGASFGLLWSLISPFLMLAVYTIAFGEILKGRWPQAPDSNAEFSLILFLGIIVHGFFAECFIRAPQLMLPTAITSSGWYFRWKSDLVDGAVGDVPCGDELLVFALSVCWSTNSCRRMWCCCRWCFCRWC